MTVRSEDVNDKMVDVYAYAMTMYWVFTREKPWEGLGAKDIENKVLSGERPVLKNDDKYSQIIRDAWNHKPSMRPSFETIVSRLHG